MIINITITGTNLIPMLQKVEGCCDVDPLSGKQSVLMISNDVYHMHHKKSICFIKRQTLNIATTMLCAQSHSGCMTTSALLNIKCPGGCRVVLSEIPAGPARGPPLCCGERGRWHRGPELPTFLQWGHIFGCKGRQTLAL
jgi:hypothetical protein